MGEKLRRSALAVLAVAGVYVFLLCLAAGLAQLQLIVAAMRGEFAFGVMVVLLVAGLLVMASGLAPAIVMHRFGVRSLAAYLLNAIGSGALASYAFMFNYGVGDNLGAMLMRRPVDGVNPASGWHFFAPPFVDTLRDLFRGLPALFVGAATTTNSLTEATVAFGPSLLCAVLFWIFAVRRLGRRTAQ